RRCSKQWRTRRPPEYALSRFPESGARGLDARDTARESVSRVAMHGTQSRRGNRALTKENDMSDRVRKVDYFYVMVPNTAGQAAKVLSGLAEHGVNLLAFSGFPSKGKGQLDLVPESTAALTRGAKKLQPQAAKQKNGVVPTAK